MSPEIVQVEVSTRCQLNCLMCPKYWFSCEWIAKDMDMETFCSIPFRDFKYAHLQGWGEPLLNPHIGKMIDFARRYCRVGLTTNGLLLKKHVDELLKTDLVAVSIASADRELHKKVRGCNLEEITDGIKLLSELRSKRRPKITVVTMMLKNTIGTLPQIVELASECGADEVIANNLDYLPSEKLVGMEVFSSGAERPEVREYIRLAEKRAEECGIEFTARPVRMEEALVCAENPTKNCLITVDGLIAPCVYLHLPTSSNHIVRYFNGKMFRIPKVYFGDVANFGWENKNYRKFREMFEKRTSLLHYLFSFTLPPLPEVCRTCYKAYSV